MYIIITHTDNDGFACEYAINKYLEKIDPKEPIARFNYNYSNDISFMEQFINKNLYQIKDIFITDVTLPDEFMERYAGYITHIDHHKTAIEKDSIWKDKLKNNYSKVKLDNYKGFNKKPADQISACELTWESLLSDTPMPIGLFLIGRFDVWDHDSNENTKLLNHYTNIELAKYGFDVALTEEFDRIMDDTYIKTILENSKVLKEYIDKINGAESLKSVKKVKIFDRIVAVVNKSCNSQFFNEFIKINPEVDFLINYNYDIKNKAWTVSCYTVEGKPDAAIDFLYQFKNVIPDIISIGGHRNACGMRIKQEDIIKFLNTFEVI